MIVLVKSDDLLVKNHEFLVKHHEFFEWTMMIFWWQTMTLQTYGEQNVEEEVDLAPENIIVYNCTELYHRIT